MFNIIDFSMWDTYKGNFEGSGRSEKIWLESLEANNKIGLFKFPKQFSDGEITSEHISEKLASSIATELDIPCAKVDIGTYKGRIGSMSYCINKGNETIKEGISYINNLFPDYDSTTLYDTSKQCYYSFPMIYPIIQNLNVEKEFCEMLVFDALIGNTDRHHSNWGILETNLTDIKFCPLYDNGSSLCCYINETDIDSYLGKDKRKFNSLTDTKSKSRVRLDETLKKEPTHREILLFLQQHQSLGKYYNNLTDKIISIMSKQKIEQILNEYPTDILSQKKKELIFRFLEQKVNIIKQISKGG